MGKYGGGGARRFFNVLLASDEYVDDVPVRFKDDGCEEVETGGAGAGRLPRTWARLLDRLMELSLHVRRWLILCVPMLRWTKSQWDTD